MVKISKKSVLLFVFVVLPMGGFFILFHQLFVTRLIKKAKATNTVVISDVAAVAQPAASTDELPVPANETTVPVKDSEQTNPPLTYPV